MLRIWGRKNSINVQKVMWAVGELGLSQERIDAGGQFGGLNTDAFGKMNPNRRVPVIEDGGVVIWESHAILRYLAAKYGGGSLWPVDAAARSQCDMWMDWTLADLQSAFIGLFWSFWRTPEPQRNLRLIQQQLARSNVLFQILEKHFDGRKFITGDQLTMGDIPAGAQLYRYFNLSIERPALPNVQAWYARLRERDSYRTNVMISFEDLKGRSGF